jgi:hypothetical protein
VEVFTLEHLRDGELACQADESFKTQLAEPVAVEADFGFVAVEDLEDLSLVSFCVGVDLLASAGRVVMRPEGSPMRPVKSPIKKMTVWPMSWKCLSLRMSTVCPTWRSGAVGSNPALTRMGLPVAMERSMRSRRSDSRMISAAPLRR